MTLTTRRLQVALLLLLAVCAPAAAIAQEVGYLGIQYRELRKSEAEALGWSAPRGTLITKVIAGTPADKAGLKSNDIVLSVDGVETTGTREKTEVKKDAKGGETHVTELIYKLDETLKSKRPGQTVTLQIVRDKAELQLKATLIARPPAAALVPTCRGADLLLELKEKEPAAYAEIAKVATEALNGRALLWRIEKVGLKPSYLLGTIHVSDDRVHVLSPALKKAFESTTRLALEIDLSPEAISAGIAQAGKYFVYERGRSLKTELNEADYKAAGEVMNKRGVPAASLDGMRPWQISLMLAMPSCETLRQGHGLKSLDGRLSDMAKERGIPVIGLETVADQLGAMAGLKREHEAAILVGALRTQDRADDHFETMVRLYLNRQIGAMFAWQRHLARQLSLPTAAIDELEDALVTRRNHKMREATLPHLAKGELFIGVGAGHLPGRDGLVELLRGAGYTLTAIE